MRLGWRDVIGGSDAVEDIPEMAQDTHSTDSTSAIAPTTAAQDPGGEVTIILFHTETTVTRLPGETVLDCARRAGLSPPYSCEKGDCGTCMAKLVEGSATMRVNDALMDDEVADGYVLTCQAITDVAEVTVNYDE